MAAGRCFTARPIGANPDIADAVCSDLPDCLSFSLGVNQV
jgi:hypothetical protein